MDAFDGVPIKTNQMVPDNEAWVMVDGRRTVELWVRTLPKNETDPVEAMKNMVFKRKHWAFFVGPWLCGRA